MRRCIVTVASPEGGARGGDVRSVCGILAVLAVAAASCSADPPPRPEPQPETTRTATQGIAGNISPGAIEIDSAAGNLNGADLYDDLGTPLNLGAALDWVDELTGNTGTDCLDPDTSIASCVEPGITGAIDGEGTWNGIRIVDGIAGGDQDIFLTGGKENDVSTWNIGPGTVGASKSDLTQAYLANNQDNLFFAMERRANNGTTAFDFEFNQVPPGTDTCPGEIDDPDDPNDPVNLIPCRTKDDVLFTFEMQGSGNTGSAVPHVYLWVLTPSPSDDAHAGSYVEVMTLPDGVFSSINEAATPAGPWGRVDSGGDWVLDDFLRFELAEATAPLDLLSGVDECGGTAYVQVRTRSSAQANSDLKDTSRVFEFQFNSMSAEATLTPSCDPGVHYDATASDADGNPIADPDCDWSFTTDEGTADEATFTIDDDCDGDVPAANLVGVTTISATVTVTSGSTGTCSATDGAGPATVLSPITVSIAPDSLGATCDSDPTVESTEGIVTYTATVQGGDGSYTYDWTIDACDGFATCEVGEGADLCHDETLSVTVDDGSTSCPADTSEEETYSKVTIVTASDNTGGEGGAGGGGGGAP